MDAPLSFMLSPGFVLGSTHLFEASEDCSRFVPDTALIFHGVSQICLGVHPDFKNISQICSRFMLDTPLMFDGLFLDRS